MAMTREQVLAEMEADFVEMSEEERSAVLFSNEGRDWAPKDLIQAVREDTEMGKRYVESWSANREQEALLSQLLDQLLGPCNDPDCKVHGHGGSDPSDG